MKYFVTHGQGLQPFVLSNCKFINEKFSDNFSVQVSQNEDEQFIGKIIFEANPNKDNKDQQANYVQITRYLLDHFKSVERMFGLVYLEKNVNQMMDDSIEVKRRRQQGLTLTDLYNFVLKIGPTLSDTLETWAQIQLAIRGDKINSDVVDEDGINANKRPKLDESQKYSFRVDAKATGRYRSMLKANQISKCIGSALVKSLSKSATNNNACTWDINLTNPTLTLNVFITEEVAFLCGVSLTSHPISERTYLQTIPGRSTISYSLASLVVSDNEIQTKTAEDEKEEKQEKLNQNDKLLILDCMTGASTILIECMKSFSDKVLLAFGMDQSIDQILKSQSNIEKSGESDKIVNILHDSTKSFPFRQDIIFDGIVVDFPFGVQHGSYESSVKNLPIIFNNIHQWVKSHGNIVLLISLSLSNNLEESAGVLSWKLLNKYPVKLGALQAVIYHYLKD